MNWTFDLLVPVAVLLAAWIAWSRTPMRLGTRDELVALAGGAVMLAVIIAAIWAVAL